MVEAEFEWHPTTDGGRLAVWTRMGSRSPQVLLVHGLASNARLWDGAAALLESAGYSTVQVDLRGHGLSDKQDTGYDFPTLAADLAGLISGRMKPPVMAVGQSFGGNLVLDLAVRYPEIVSSVVCVDGGFIDLASQFGDWEKCVAALTPPPLTHLTPASLAEAATELYSGWPPEGIQAQLANLEETEDGFIRHRLALPHHLAILRAMFDQSPLLLAEACQQPALVVAAENELAGKSDHVDAFVKRLRRGRAVWLRGHHDLHAEQPANLVDTIRQSLNDGFLL